MTRLLLVRAAGVGGMFGEGRTQFSLEAGSAYAFDKSYLVIGGSASYYVVDGLGVGLSLKRWSGDGPGITKYSPFVQYIFYQVPVVQPYVGAFYRHTAIAALPSINSTGVHAGALMALDSNAFVSVGVVHESYRDCQESLYRVCSETHPDIALIFGF